MTTGRPISEAKSADLRGVPAALGRAAERARHAASRLGLGVVIEREGKVEVTYPIALERILGVYGASSANENTDK